MNYAIVEISGKQFWVEIGKYYDLNKISIQSGKYITFNRVLLVKAEKKTFIGRPYLNTVKIKAEVLKHFRGKKTIVYKMRPKKKSRKKQGHRQELTRVLVHDIIIK